MRLARAKLPLLDRWRLLRDPHLRIHYGQSAEDAVLGRLFGQRRGGFYVDIGAHHPRKLSNTHVLHRYFGWTGINVDASERAIALFRAERPGDVNLVALVGAPGAAVTFTEYAGSDGPRSTADPARIARFAGAAVPVRATATMEPQPLAAIMEAHAGGRRIDLLTIDIEGFDLQALQSNDWDRFRPAVICVEDFDADGEGSAIAAWLEGLGYTRVSRCFETSIYRDRAG